MTFLNLKDRGNSLVFVLIFIAILSVGMGMIIKNSLNTKSVATSSHDETIAKQAANEAVQAIKGNVIESIRFLSELKISNSANFAQAFQDYATNYQYFLTGNHPNYPRPSVNFSDWAKKNGYRSGILKPAWTAASDDITYQFSVRCLKDESNVGNPGPSQNPNAAYLRGDIDGCPVDATGMNTVNTLTGDGLPIVNFYRANWRATPVAGIWPANQTAFDNWVRLPKRVEIVVSAKKGKTISTVREIATAQPVMLNDYAFALGRVPASTDASHPFQLYADQFFGRVHFDNGDLTPGATPENQYRLRINAETQSAFFLRPFTTGGLRVDAIESINNPNDPVQLRVAGNNTINFMAGFDTSAPALNIPTTIQASVDAARAAPASPLIHRFPSRQNCNAQIFSGNESGSRPYSVPTAVVKCRAEPVEPWTQTVITLNPTEAHALVFESDVSIRQSLIKYPVSVYSNRDITFEGSVAYDIATNSAYAGKVFIPENDPHPTAGNVVHPLDKAAHDYVNNTNPIPALHNNHSALALWVARRDINIDSTNIRPLERSSLSSNIDNGSIYELVDTTTNPSVQAGQLLGGETPMPGNLSNNRFDKITLISGKIQAGGDFKVLTPNSMSSTFNDQTNLNNMENFGALVLPGGATVGGITKFKRTYQYPGVCPVQNCIRGFNNVASWFDNRPDYDQMLGQTPLLGQVNWSTISYETTYEGGLFGDNSQILDNGVTVVSHTGSVQMIGGGGVLDDGPP